MNLSQLAVLGRAQMDQLWEAFTDGVLADLQGSEKLKIAMDSTDALLQFLTDHPLGLEVVWGLTRIALAEVGTRVAEKMVQHRMES